MNFDVLEKPVKAELLRPVAIRRRIKNHIATILFLASFLIALLPLGWVLSVVVARAGTP